jgi:hypothetical protein
MTEEKIEAALATYEKLFQQLRIKKRDYPHDKLLMDKVAGLGHCYGMIGQMRIFLKDGRLAKVQRWLGFIQGCVWSQGLLSVNDLKEHNRST